MNICKPSLYFWKTNMRWLPIILLALLCGLSFSVSSEPGKKAGQEFHAKQYFTLPTIPNDIGQAILLIELESSMSMLERAYSSSSFSAAQGDGAQGYFKPHSQYRYHSSQHYFEAEPSLKRGQNGAWDGRFLNWLLMRQVDMVRYLLLGTEAQNQVNEADFQEMIDLHHARQALSLQDAQSASYSPIPNNTRISLSSGQLSYHGKHFRLRLKKPNVRRGLVSLLTNNIDLYFYTQEAQKFIFGDDKQLISYLMSSFLAETKQLRTGLDDSSATLRRALNDIKQRVSDSGSQGMTCQRYVHLSLTSRVKDSTFLKAQNLLADCQQALKGKQPLKHFQLVSSDMSHADSEVQVNSKASASFQQADSLISALFKAFYQEYPESSFRLSGAAMGYYPDKSGIVYQALSKYAKVSNSKSLEDLHWLGNLNATLVDKEGRLRSDNGDRTLGSLNEDPLISSCYDDADKQLRIRLMTKPQPEVHCNLLNYPYLETDVGYVWQASDFLNKLPQATIARQRVPFHSSDSKRYIRTHYAETEYDFIGADYVYDTSPIKPEWLHVSDQKDADKLIAFVRGQEQEGFRRRHDMQGQYLLGDTMTSKPVVVGKPSSNYHLLYADPSYQAFIKQYQNRRSRIFLGSNDGMLHSFNAGWFDQATKRLMNSPNNASEWSLGQEIWAFIPSLVLPYLKELSHPNYGMSPYHHLQLAPKKPYIFDAKVFTNNSLNRQKDRVFIDHEGQQLSQETHPHAWGTLMLVGVGLEQSSYLLFDITDAEQAPKLMAELRIKELGSAISLATVMTEKNQQGVLEWKLVLGSGTDLDFESVNELTSKRRAGLYIYDLQDIASSIRPLTPKYIDLKEAQSYVSGVSAADWNVDGETDALYVNTTNTGHHGGSLYRLNTGTQRKRLIAEKLLDIQAPLIGRPQLSVDANNNRWIYLASAGHINKRISHMSDEGVKDKIIGVKEPRDSKGFFVLDRSIGRPVRLPLSGLLNVTDVLVDQKTGDLSGSLNLEPALQENTVQHLEERLVQFTSASEYLDGWVRHLDNNEFANGSSHLFAGFLTQASYQVEYKNCRISADAYVHRLRYTTGTAWYAQSLAEYQAKKMSPELRSTKSVSQGAKEITSLLLQVGDDQIHQIQSSASGHTKRNREDGRSSLINGEVSWREL